MTLNLLAFCFWSYTTYSAKCLHYSFSAHSPYVI